MDRDEFMELVYETFADEPDNVLANGIIEAADAYVEHEKAKLSKEGTTPAIPLPWIWKYIKWLQSLGNVLADQAGAHILAMVHKWGDEQNETD